MPGMTWSLENDRKLFLSVLKIQKVKVDFEAVAQELTTEDTTCTPRAVQERLKKLIAMAEVANGGEGKHGGTPGPKAKATPGSKRKTTDKATDDGTPTKKPRKAVAKGKTAKVEVDDMDSADACDLLVKEEVTET